MRHDAAATISHHLRNRSIAKDTVDAAGNALRYTVSDVELRMNAGWVLYPGPGGLGGGFRASLLLCFLRGVPARSAWLGLYVTLEVGGQMRDGLYGHGVEHER